MTKRDRTREANKTHFLLFSLNKNKQVDVLMGALMKMALNKTLEPIDAIKMQLIEDGFWKKG